MYQELTVICTDFAPEVELQEDDASLVLSGSERHDEQKPFMSARARIVIPQSMVASFFTKVREAETEWDELLAEDRRITEEAEEGGDHETAD